MDCPACGDVIGRSGIGVSCGFSKCPTQYCDDQCRLVHWPQHSKTCVFVPPVVETKSDAQRASQGCPRCGCSVSVSDWSTHWTGEKASGFTPSSTCIRNAKPRPTDFAMPSSAMAIAQATTTESKHHPHKRPSSVLASSASATASSAPTSASSSSASAASVKVASTGGM